MTDYTTFEAHLLVGCYLLAEQSGEEVVSVRDVFRRFRFDPRAHWLDRALAGFVSSGLATDMRTLGASIDQEVWLNARGVKEAERLLRGGVKPPEGQSPLLNASVESGPSETPAREAPPPIVVPASDRIVTLDHNNPAISQAISDAKQLGVALRESNDVGAMSPEAVTVAIEEVTEITQALERPAVRMPAFGERAKSTLTWIGKEAAGALVGAAALTLLALLATIFGIPF